MTTDDAGALRRILEEVGRPDLVDLLADDLSGADLTTLLLEVMRRKASRVAAPDLMRRYGADRFVAPAVAGSDRLRRVEEGLIRSLPPAFEMVELSPLVPLGTHSAVGPVDQNWVVSTIRGTEVAADPTNGLALEAARRRRDLLRLEPRSPDLVRLAAGQRVARGQRIEGPVSFAHFGLFGIVTAGRDVGNLTFEREAAAEHVGFAVQALLAAGAERVTIELTDFEGTMTAVRHARWRNARGGGRRPRRLDAEAGSQPEGAFVHQRVRDRSPGAPSGRTVGGVTVREPFGTRRSLRPRPGTPDGQAR
jgi:hypothetical protein